MDQSRSGWWACCMAGWAGFVGRNRELPRLRGALVGDTRLLLVVGDAGVGKTRFAGEGMRRAAAQGTVLLWAGCLPLAEKLPLLPVVEAVGALGKLDGGLLGFIAITSPASVPSYRGCGGRPGVRIGQPRRLMALRSLDSRGQALDRSPAASACDRHPDLTHHHVGSSQR